jgi:hypothetical protein
MLTLYFASGASPSRHHEWAVGSIRCRHPSVRTVLAFRFGSIQAQISFHISQHTTNG